MQFETTGEVDMSSGDGTEDDPWAVVDEDGNVVGYVWGNECGWWFEDDSTGEIDGITGGDNGWHDAQGLDDFSGDIVGENGLFTEEFLLFVRLNGITSSEYGDSEALDNGGLIEDPLSLFLLGLIPPGITMGILLGLIFDN